MSERTTAQPPGSGRPGPSRPGPSRNGNGNGIVIVGAGLAGLFTALKLAPLPVTVIAAAPLGEGASSGWAQGGIAAAVGEGDTTEAHARDTIKVGAGIVDEDIARLVADEGPDRVRDLLGFGVPFDRDDAGGFVLSREAAHSTKRVVRVSGDQAGAAIMQALIARTRETPSITVLEGCAAHRLEAPGGEVTGIQIQRDPTFGGGSAYLPATAVVLATGGIGGLYAVTTNPSFVRGMGLNMAFRAGATISDAEFVQFHPTALDIGKDPAPLATEALRGEGALLVNRDGERFMTALHGDAELAPRDIVARGVFAELEAGRGAFLDCRQAIGARFASAFPTVYTSCQEAGIDPVKDLIPVAPAEHYHMGGVATDENGKTDLPGLWAVGEVAATGLHGANRLASNSLLEALVFGARAADNIAAQYAKAQAVDIPAFNTAGRGWTIPASDNYLALLRKTMSNGVGVLRSAESLRRAISDLLAIRNNENARHRWAIAEVATYIAVSALKREESRGAHFRSDFPAPDAALAQRSRLKREDLMAVIEEIDPGHFDQDGRRQ